MTSKDSIQSQLKQLEDIAQWFENNDEFDIEEGLKKVKEGADLVKKLKTRVKQVENEFRDITNSLKDEE